MFENESDNEAHLDRCDDDTGFVYMLNGKNGVQIKLDSILGEIELKELEGLRSYFIKDEIFRELEDENLFRYEVIHEMIADSLKDHLKDIELWNLFRSGNKDAFEFIYNREYESMVNYARGYSKDIEKIEDAIHDIFVNLWKRKESLSDCDNIRPYLLISLRNAMLKAFKRSNKIELKEDNESFHGSDSSIEDDIIEAEFSQEMSTRLNQAFLILSDRQKEAIFLRYMESMDYDDICQIMDINYLSVRNLISKGVKKLSEYFKEKKGST